MKILVSFYVLFMQMNCQHHKSGQFFLLKLCNLLDKFKYTLDAEPPNSERNTQAVIAPSTAGRSTALKWKARKAGQEAAQREQGEPAFGEWERGGGRGREEGEGSEGRIDEKKKENKKKCKGKSIVEGQ